MFYRHEPMDRAIFLILRKPKMGEGLIQNSQNELVCGEIRAARTNIVTKRIILFSVRVASPRRADGLEKLRIFSPISRSVFEGGD